MRSTLDTSNFDPSMNRSSIGADPLAAAADASAFSLDGAIAAAQLRRAAKDEAKVLRRSKREHAKWQKQVQAIHSDGQEDALSVAREEDTNTVGERGDELTVRCGSEAATERMSPDVPEAPLQEYLTRDQFESWANSELNKVLGHVDDVLVPFCVEMDSDTAVRNYMREYLVSAVS